MKVHDTWRQPLVLVHAGLVAGLVLMLAVLDRTHPDDPPDANIGAGIVGMLLGLLGLPWSAVFVIVDLLRETEDGTLGGVILCVAAVLNVVLHGAVRSAFARRTPGNGSATT